MLVRGITVREEALIFRIIATGIALVLVVGCGTQAAEWEADWRFDQEVTWGVLLSDRELADQCLIVARMDDEELGGVSTGFRGVQVAVLLVVWAAR